MYSKAIELTGLALLGLGTATLLGTGAALLVGGASLLLVGGTTDDAQVARTLRRGAARARLAWRRQVARENGEPLPEDFPQVRCVCGGDAECPLCHGEGWVPNPAARVGAGPHPPIQVDPETDAAARTLADARRRRGDGRMREATP